MYPKTVTCPCCQFPTLGEAGGFEICIVCWWEDDGQSDDDADRVRGGPNGRYSLSEAQRNFQDHGHMYDKGAGIEAVERPSIERQNLMRYLSSIGLDATVVDLIRLGEFLTAEDRELRRRS